MRSGIHCFNCTNRIAMVLPSTTHETCYHTNDLSNNGNSAKENHFEIPIIRIHFVRQCVTTTTTNCVRLHSDHKKREMNCLVGSGRRVRSVRMINVHLTAGQRQSSSIFRLRITYGRLIGTSCRMYDWFEISIEITTQVVMQKIPDLEMYTRAVSVPCSSVTLSGISSLAPKTKCSDT